MREETVTDSHWHECPACEGNWKCLIAECKVDSDKYCYACYRSLRRPVSEQVPGPECADKEWGAFWLRYIMEYEAYVGRRRT